MNDIQQGPSFPTSPAPTNGMLWCLTSGSAPYIIYRYNTTGAKWESTIYTSLAAMDSTASGQLSTAYNGINDLGNDSIITRFERSLIRGYINDITGLWLNPADAMPSIATIDASSIGSLASLRKGARDIGVSTGAGTNYANAGTNYTSLVTYLSGMSPKPWDTTATGNITIVRNTWNSTWKAFYDSFNLLQVDVQDRQKAYADTASGNAQSGAIAAVQNAVAHATVNIANPVTINAPVATIGLPEFQGYHTDSWYVNGKNLALKSNTGWSSTAYNVMQGTLSENWVDGGEYTITIKGTINSGQQFGLWRDTGSALAGYFTYDSAADLHRLHITSLPTTPQTGKNTFSVYNTPSTTATNATIQWIKIERGSTFSVFTPAPEEMWAVNGNRIQPILDPIFSTGTDLTMNVALYGDGTNNDSVSWDANGNLIKQKLWSDISLDSRLNWSMVSSATGYKQVKATGFASTVTNSTVQAVKFDGSYLTAVAGTFTAANQVSLQNTDNALYLTVAGTDSGWGDSYSSTAADIGAFFLGWKLCNGTYNTAYNAKREVDTLTVTAAATTAGNVTVSLNGTTYTIAVAAGDSTTSVAAKIKAATYTGYTASVSGAVVTFTATQDVLTAPTFSAGSTGVAANMVRTTIGDVKTWYPFSDTNLNRATNTANGAPTTVSPSIAETKINPYQVVYRLGTPFQETGFTFDGILALIQGNNTVSISYPTLYTPAITTGTIKYATNLATATQDLTYVIPTTMTRLVNAERKTTDDSLINVVTQSVTYQTALQTKANSADLSNYADKGTVNTLSNTVSGLDTSVNGTNGINSRLSTFATTSYVDQKATGIVESFHTSGGMNLLLNSVGYSIQNDGTIDFWTQYTAYKVKTQQNSDLQTLGFGSGFYFPADGQNKGITQTVSVVKGQPMTLSWYLNKTKSGGDSTYRFFIQILEKVNNVWTVMQQIADNSGTTTNGVYDPKYMTYTPQSTSVQLAFISYANCEAYLTGIMFSIGTVPIQWTLATGESYNTNVSMNINGVRISQFDVNKNETGYTQITPQEFAGYAATNNSGTFEKVFYLNGDETVTKKITATNSMTMGNIKILPISSAANTGWAFVQNN